MNKGALVLLGIGVGGLALLAGSSSGGFTLSGTATRDYILKAFKAANLPDALGRAAAVNAYAESRWDSTLDAYQYPDPVTGAREDSLGIFQLNAAPGALGERYALPRLPNNQPNPLDPRLNPLVQCTVVIAAAKQSTWLATLIREGTASTATFTLAFAQEVERPRDGGVSRPSLIPKLFPGVS